MSQIAIERRHSPGMAAPSEVPQVSVPQALFDTTEPFEIIERSVTLADVLMRVVADRQLAYRFAGKDWLGVSAYQMLAAFLGVTTSLEWCRRIDGAEGWEARFAVHGPDGRILGHGEGMVMRTERNWRQASDHSLRAMAQTRGQRRALQSVLGFILTTAGYDTSDPSGRATRKQITALHTIAGGLGWDDTERHRRAGVESFSDLTRAEAGELIDAWGTAPDEIIEERAAGQPRDAAGSTELAGSHSGVEVTHGR